MWQRSQKKQKQPQVFIFSIYWQCPNISNKIESLLVFLHILSHQERRKLLLLMWLFLFLVRLVRRKLKILLSNYFNVYHWYDKTINPWLVVKCDCILLVLLLVSDSPISVVYMVLQCQLCASRSNGGMTLVQVCNTGLYYRSVPQVCTTYLICTIELYHRSVLQGSLCCILQICNSDLYCILCD